MIYPFTPTCVKRHCEGCKPEAIQRKNKTAKHWIATPQAACNDGMGIYADYHLNFIDSEC